MVAGGNSTAALIRQGIYAVLGLVAMAVAAACLPPVAAADPAGDADLDPAAGGRPDPRHRIQVGSSARWIDIGPLTIQPSEFAKLAVALFACQVLASRRRPPTTVRQLLNPVGVVALVACALVLAEPDLGTTISISIKVVVAGTPVSAVAAVGEWRWVSRRTRV